MNEERIWELIGRQLAGEANKKEVAEIEQWRHTHPDNDKIYQTICEYWQSKEAVPTSHARHVWSILEKRINEHGYQEEKTHVSQKFYLWKLLKVAAVITLLLVSGLIFFHYRKQLFSDVTAKTEINPKGKRSKFTLPDGSQVWLNADSKLSYSDAFGEDKREIHLSGEAFFEVVRSPDLPFVIYLDNSRIQVLGTSFNVKFYKNDETVETSVLTGKVAFIRKTENAIQQDTAYYITPNYKLAFSKSSGLVEKLKVDSREDMAWTKGKLIFKNATWNAIAKTLERNYNTSIEFDNDALRNCRLTATFNGKTLKEILELIAMTQEFSYKTEQNRIVIMGRGC